MPTKEKNLNNMSFSYKLINIIISILKELKKPFFYSTALGLCLTFSVLTTNNKIVNSLIIIVISIVYLVAIIYENRTNSLLENAINFTLFALIASPLMVYAIVLIMKVVSPALEIIGNQSAWIGFYGSLFGGSLVMFALIFTIQHENEIESSKSIPLLTVTYMPNERDSNQLNTMITKNQDNIVIGPTLFSLTIENSTPYMAKDVTIKSIRTANDNLHSGNESVKYVEQKLLKEASFITILDKSSIYTYYFFLEHTDPNSQLNFDIIIELEYLDTFKLKKYKHITKYKIYKKFSSSDEGFFNQKKFEDSLLLNVTDKLTLSVGKLDSRTELLVD